MTSVIHVNRMFIHLGVARQTLKHLNLRPQSPKSPSPRPQVLIPKPQISPKNPKIRDLQPLTPVTAKKSPSSQAATALRMAWVGHRSPALFLADHVGLRLWSLGFGTALQSSFLCHQLHVKPFGQKQSWLTALPQAPFRFGS